MHSRPTTSWGPPFKQERTRKTCESDVSAPLHERVALTFFFFFFFLKKTLGKLVKPATFWGDKEPEFREHRWQVRRKSQRVRCLSPNTNCVKFLKTYIINKWYCTNVILFSSFLFFLLLAHHETSVNKWYCTNVFLFSSFLFFLLLAHHETSVSQPLATLPWCFSSPIV